jgi:hypothetical protein
MLSACEINGLAFWRLVIAPLVSRLDSPSRPSQPHQVRWIDWAAKRCGPLSKKRTSGLAKRLGLRGIYRYCAPKRDQAHQPVDVRGNVRVGARGSAGSR